MCTKGTSYALEHNSSQQESVSYTVSRKVIGSDFDNYDALVFRVKRSVALCISVSVLMS